MSTQIRLVVLATMVVFALPPGSPARAQTPAPPTTTEPAAKAPTATKAVLAVAKRFKSPEEAAEALAAAVRAHDTNALLGIFGSEARTLISSGDPVADRQTRDLFVQRYDASHRLVPAGATVTLQIGNDDWPFPIPLVKDRDQWRFDVRQGREEIIARRIGRNELNTMQVCLAFVDAQREYYAEDRNGDGILEYAQRFQSSPGQRDGLYWPSQPGEPPSPLGDLVVRAQARGYQLGKTARQAPFHGYLFRILTGQGPAAPDGVYDYIVSGHMIAGFAMVAFPAEYGVSGVMTFIVNQDGIVYQKDLGPTSGKIAAGMRRFDPDSSWAKVDVDAPAAQAGVMSRP